MEYREPSRIVAAEGRVGDLNDDAESASRMRRFEFVRPTGRLDTRRVLAAVVLLASILAVVFYLGGHAIDGAVRWLHRQPRYQLRFDQIELSAPPPSCFRGGAAAFLERVRKNANEPEVLPVLDLAPDRIERAFKLFPWVERVDSIDFPPRGLVVHLAYNVPVAKVLFPTGEQFVLDRHAHLLPIEDIDVECVGGLIQISGQGVVPPKENRTGLVWKTETPDRPELANIDRGVLQAAELAAFLLEPDRIRQAQEMPALRVFVVSATDPHGRGLFVQNAERAMILWGRGPGEEQPGEPSALEKWKILTTWAKNKSLTAGSVGDYWMFSQNELRFIQASRPKS